MGEIAYHPKYRSVPKRRKYRLTNFNYGFVLAHALNLLAWKGIIDLGKHVAGYL